ncbi:hypothetical protein, partial [Streptomyces sp. NPDC005485]|uniref:5' nucleotidase, NT5C type n=1 Tax=Streptomyces sp. NPDC005485 TaxID=3155591 RepID=UPI0033A9A989
RIGAAGFRPRVCSSPLSANPWSDRAKRAWLTRHFGARVAHEAVVVDDKSGHDGIALIDDRPHIKNSARATWQHVVFDASYNRRSPAPRLLGWRDPRLPTLLTEARDRYLSR